MCRRDFRERATHDNTAAAPWKGFGRHFRRWDCIRPQGQGHGELQRKTSNVRPQAQGSRPPLHCGWRAHVGPEVCCSLRRRRLEGPCGVGDDLEPGVNMCKVTYPVPVALGMDLEKPHFVGGYGEWRVRSNSVCHRLSCSGRAKHLRSGNAPTKDDNL